MQAALCPTCNQTPCVCQVDEPHKSDADDHAVENHRRSLSQPIQGQSQSQSQSQSQPQPFDPTESVIPPAYISLQGWYNTIVRVFPVLQTFVRQDNNMGLVMQFHPHAAAGKMNPGGPNDHNILGKRKREDRDGDPDDQGSDPCKRFASGCGILLRFFRQ